MNLSNLGRTWPFVLFLANAALVGCSHVHVRTDYDPTADFARYRTFSFSGGKAVSRLGAVQVNEPLVSERIQEAVTRQLEAKGLRPSTENPDLLVTFVAGARERTELESTGPAFYGAYGWVGWGPGWWGPGYDEWWTRHYTQGTLVVDLIDAQSKRLVWRAYAQADLDDPNQAAAAIQRALTQAFHQYPPPPARYGGPGR